MHPLDALIATWTKSTPLTDEAASGPPPAHECMRIDEVSPVGPAALAGCVPGDLLVQVDERPAASFGSELGAHWPPPRRFRIWRARTGESFQLESEGCPLGVHLKPPPEALIWTALFTRSTKYGMPFLRRGSLACWKS